MSFSEVEPGRRNFNKCYRLCPFGSSVFTRVKLGGRLSILVIHEYRQVYSAAKGTAFTRKRVQLSTGYLIEVSVFIVITVGEIEPLLPSHTS